ncbi:MAG: uroporphyrinogen-III synthase [Fuerstiella sp.]|nr:uroporphyrinogen-III synthase [Fuerstiella sp.]
MLDLPVVCSFESRRAEQMFRLIERHGGQPIVAPSMQEIPLENNRPAVRGIHLLALGKVDFLILLTGVGTTAMMELARSISLEQRLLEQMACLPIIVRGPKPAAVIHRLGLQPAISAESPNTWREVMAAIDAAGLSLQGRTVAVQEYGVSSPDLTGALQCRGAAVQHIPVYRWALPEKQAPLRQAIHTSVDGKTDMTLFTSAQQLRHVLQVARELGLEDKWLGTVPNIGSIGPTCSDAIREAGLQVWFEADPPKMGPLVRGALEQYSS